jgi:hypothetical protein
MAIHSLTGAQQPRHDLEFLKHRSQLAAVPLMLLDEADSLT